MCPHKFIKMDHSRMFCERCGIGKVWVMESGAATKHNLGQPIASSSSPSPLTTPQNPGLDEAEQDYQENAQTVQDLEAIVARTINELYPEDSTAEYDSGIEDTVLPGERAYVSQDDDDITHGEIFG